MYAIRSYYDLEVHHPADHVVKKGIGADIEADLVAALAALSARSVLTLLVEGGAAVITRITSYNVCYTKLLRESQVQKSAWKANRCT